LGVFILPNVFWEEAECSRLFETKHIRNQRFMSDM
jgi:hypothetical protein